VRTLPIYEVHEPINELHAWDSAVWVSGDLLNLPSWSKSVSTQIGVHFQPHWQIPYLVCL